MKHRRRLEFFETPGGNSPVEDAIADLDPPTQAYAASRIQMLEDHGLQLGTEHVRLVSGWSPLRELRISHNKREFRLLFYPDGDGFVAVHFVQKRSTKALKRDLELATDRMRSWRRRSGR